MAYSVECLRGRHGRHEDRAGVRRNIKRYTARKRRRLWKQHGEDAPTRVRDLTTEHST